MYDKTVSSSFSWWNTKSDGTGTQYASGSTYRENASATLYAQWNDGTLDSLPTPTRDGYSFTGWFTKPTGGSIVTTSTKITGNMTIYAHWEQLQTYTITYNANGGSGGPSSQIKVEDVTLTLSTKTPSRANSSSSFTVAFNANGGSVSPASCTVKRTESYTFRDWNTEADGSGISYIAGASYTENEDATLYAQWSSSFATSAFTLPTPVRDGYTFTGWFSAAIGGTQVTSSTAVSSDMTVFAHWSKLPTYTIRYDANGGTGAPAMQSKIQGVNLTLSTDKPNKSNTVTFDYGTGSNETRTISAVFSSWNTSADGTGTSYVPGAIYTSDVGVTLYAQWTNGVLGELPTPIRDGYTFTGWFSAANGGTQVTSSTAVSSDMTVFAHWTPDYIPGPESITARIVDGTLIISGQGSMQENREIVDAVIMKDNFGYNSTITDIRIEDGITDIAESIFSRLVSLERVSIANSVNKIGEGAFKYCNNLVSVQMPEYVSEIGAMAFNNCSNLTDITIPKGLKVLDQSLFSGCSSLADIVIPYGVEHIHNYAFRDCTSLTSFVIPGSVKEISLHSFAGCSNLTSITIPPSVTTYSSSVFPGCDKLVIYGAAGSAAQSMAERWGIPFVSILAIDVRCENGTLKIIGTGSMDSTVVERIQSYKNSNVIAVEIFSGIDNIADSAFAGFEDVRRVTIPDTVVSIGSYAFSDCIRLSAIAIPDSVTSIGSYAFRNCYSLSSIALPDNLTAIEPGAFYGCSLRSLHLPASCNFIGEYAFFDAFSFHPIEVNGHNAADIEGSFDEETPDSSSPGSDSSDTDNLSISVDNVVVTIPASVRQIESYAFSSNHLLNKIIFENGDGIEIAENFVSGCSTDLIIEAPIGSEMFRSIDIYRSYLCAPNPEPDDPEPETGRYTP